MNHVFKDYLRNLFVFFDDILVYSDQHSSHLYHLERVLQRLDEHQLRIKRSKCTFFKQQVGYLGHIISKHGVKVDTEKRQAILQWLVPKNLRNSEGS